MDTGPYTKDPEEYRKLVEELYRDYKGVTLGPEYEMFVQKNLLAFLVRLSRYKFVARLLRPRDRVLEVGCGTGLGAIFLAQHCREVLGIDVKSYEIDEARSIVRRDNVRFEVAEFFDHPAAGTWDVVASLDVLEHMSPEDGDRFLAHAAASLAPGGMLVLGTPSRYAAPHQGAFSRAAHVHLYDRDELVELLERRFARVLPFSMNDEVIHTGHPGMAWYYFAVAFGPR